MRPSERRRAVRRELHLQVAGIALGLAVALGLAACDRTPAAVAEQASRLTDNPDIQVTRMFRRGDCTIYRFSTSLGENPQYYADCTALEAVSHDTK